MHCYPTPIHPGRPVLLLSLYCKCSFELALCRTQASCTSSRMLQSCLVDLLTMSNAVGMSFSI